MIDLLGSFPANPYQPFCPTVYNHLSLREARRNFRELGAVSREAVERTRDPTEEEVRNPNWPYE